MIILKSKSVNEQTIYNLQKFLQDEEYETDTISVDVVEIGKIGM